MADRRHEDPRRDDAIALLTTDHRMVENLFASHFHSRDRARCARLEGRLCTELRIHMAVMDELFYPALDGRIDARLLRRGRIAHDGARRLIREIETAGAGDGARAARIDRLARRIGRLIRAEEAPARGLFARSRAAGVDLAALGGRIRSRREELALRAERDGLPPPDPAPGPAAAPFPFSAR